MIIRDNISEEHLVECLKSGNREAQARLYTESVGALSSLCRRYLQDEDDVHDVLHDVYLKAMTEAPRFLYRGPGSLSAWLSRIAVNAAIDHLRRRLNFDPIDEDVAAIPNDDPDPSLLTPDELHAIIRGLPDGYRTVVNLYAIEGMSHRDIADQLGITPATSASQFHRAKALLAKRINEYLNS